MQLTAYCHARHAYQKYTMSTARVILVVLLRVAGMAINIIDAASDPRVKKVQSDDVSTVGVARVTMAIVVDMDEDMPFKRLESSPHCCASGTCS